MLWDWVGRERFSIAMGFLLTLEAWFFGFHLSLVARASSCDMHRSFLGLWWRWKGSWEAVVSGGAQCS